MAVEKGARVIPDRVESICWVEGKPEVSAKKGLPQIYDFVTGAVGVNTNALKIVEGLDFGYTAPETSRTYICELPLGEDLVQQYVGNAMHVFLLDLPGLEFAALIPKGEHATAVLLGEGINKDLSYSASLRHQRSEGACLLTGSSQRCSVIAHLLLTPRALPYPIWIDWC